MSRGNTRDESGKAERIQVAHQHWLDRKKGRPVQVWWRLPDGKFIPKKVAA